MGDKRSNSLETLGCVIPNRKPTFQKEFMIRGQGYDSKWDFISNTKYNWFQNALEPIICITNKKSTKCQVITGIISRLLRYFLSFLE